jgi:flagellar biosynthesis/type III secretory pathway protein FliH
MEKVNDFIESLEVQTLTDELKEDIISIVNDAIEQAYNLGRIEGMNRAVEIIKQANGES